MLAWEVSTSSSLDYAVKNALKISTCGPEISKNKKKSAYCI